MNGCRESRQSGPITKSEISEAEGAWIQSTQKTCNMATNLQLAKDEASLRRCYGRIQGNTPVFIPRKSTLARRIIEHCHTQMLHGRVSATISKVRQKHWIPKLRSLVKSVRYNCNHWKRYWVKVLRAPPTATLPSFRTEFTEPSSVTGVDFAGPLLYKSGNSGQARHSSHSSLVQARDRCISECAGTWQQRSSKDVLRSFSSKKDHHHKWSVTTPKRFKLQRSGYQH